MSAATAAAAADATELLRVVRLAELMLLAELEKKDLCADGEPIRQLDDESGFRC